MGPSFHSRLTFALLELRNDLLCELGQGTLGDSVAVQYGLCLRARAMPEHPCRAPVAKLDESVQKAEEALKEGRGGKQG